MTRESGKTARALRLTGLAACLGAFLAVPSPIGGLQSSGTPSGGALASGSSQDAPAPGPRWLEFDQPPAGSSITGFVVGYFVPGDTRPAYTFEVPRSKVQVTKSGSLRLPLLVADLPAGRTFEIRLRTVVGRQRSAWSDPSGAFTVPGQPSGSSSVTETGRGGVGTRTRPRARSAAGRLEEDPALRARLAREFPDVDLATAPLGYRTVADLAADLFAARNLKIPFAGIRKLTAEADSRNLQAAIAALKPGADARAEQRRARRQARDLLSRR